MRRRFLRNHFEPGDRPLDGLPAFAGGGGGVFLRTGAVLAGGAETSVGAGLAGGGGGGGGRGADLVRADLAASRAAFLAAAFSEARRAWPVGQIFLSSQRGQSGGPATQVSCV